MNFCLKFAKFRKNLAIISRKGDKMTAKMQPKGKCLKKENKPKTPSKELLAAIAELKDMKANPQNYKAYNSAKDLIKACLDE